MMLRYIKISVCYFWFVILFTGSSFVVLGSLFVYCILFSGLWSVIYLLFIFFQCVVRLLFPAS